MPALSCCWEYFEKGKKLYRSDKSHFESRCKTCLARCVLQLKDEDNPDIDAGLREYARSEEELDKQAELDVPPVSGKVERMVSHLTSCRNVAPDLRTFAQSLSKKENRDNIPRLSRNQEIARSVMLSPDIQMPHST
ncbi:hypothetical protein B0H14DRAFT_2568469 [Mycena olivaceomarginata]|nr:hypothetical protein B0H14DRAFT_2568469 [Mycena olivaceomarginata]